MQAQSKKITAIISSSVAIIGIAGFVAVQRGYWQPNFHFPSMSQSNSVNEAVDATEAFPTTPIDESSDVKTILSAYLFGQETAVNSVKSTSGIVPKTQQALELRGIVYVPQHPERAVALIAQAGGAAKDYLTGEVLPQGWTVHLILAEAVQIEHEGTIELLELPNSGVKLDNPNADTSTAISSDDKNAKTEPATEISVARAADGFVLNSTESATALGLQVSDKIISISGYDFGDLENDPSMLEQLLAQPSIDANVERNGEVINISVPAKLLKNWRSSIK